MRHSFLSQATFALPIGGSFYEKLNLYLYMSRYHSQPKMFTRFNDRDHRVDNLPSKALAMSMYQRAVILRILYVFICSVMIYQFMHVIATLHFLYNAIKA